MSNGVDSNLPVRRGVAVVVLREERLLVIRRSAHVPAPGKICFPGGGIEAGETEDEAVSREMLEELGVVALPQRRLWQSVTPWGVELAWWLAELEAEFTLVPNAQEVAQWQWLTPDELLLLPDLLASNREFLEAARGANGLHNLAPAPVLPGIMGT